MGYDDRSLFECVYCPICACCRLPPYGKFTVGEDYTFEYIIDGRRVTDSLGEVITFPENIFISCFEKYLILSGSRCSLEEIKAYAKAMNVNYLQEKRVLTQKRNLIAAGSAYDIWKILGRLTQFDVNYEIEPEYPYE